MIHSLDQFLFTNSISPAYVLLTELFLVFAFLILASNIIALLIDNMLSIVVFVTKRIVNFKKSRSSFKITRLFAHSNRKSTEGVSQI